MEKTTFNISGMNCKACAKLIELELDGEKGIGSAQVNFDEAKAFVEFDSNNTDSKEIKSKIEHLGYKAEEEK